MDEYSQCCFQNHGIFRGLICSDIDGSEDNTSKRMQRSGFAGINTEVMAQIYLLHASAVTHALISCVSCTFARQLAADSLILYKSCSVIMQKAKP